MGRTRWLRLLAALLALAMVAAACNGDDDDDVAGDGDGDGDATTTTELERRQVDNLLIGLIYAETGPLSPLGPPVREGLNLAIEDINAAGGVLGRDVEVIQGDEAGDPARVRDAGQRLLAQGAQVIVGAMSSGMTDEIIQIMSDNQVPQCSPSNTSPQFSDQENADFYYRTVPPDNAVGPVIADQLAADNHTSVAIAARADDYGEPLGNIIAEASEEVGLTVTDTVLYDPEATTFDAEVENLTADNPDAIVLVSFAEGAQLIQGLLEAGVGADQLYGADGIFDPTLPSGVDPQDESVLDEMTVVGAAGTDEFLERLAPETENNFIYGGQAYDCAVLMALAVETVGNLTDGEAIVEAAIQASKDGTECTTFEECKALIEDDEDIDYNGASGALGLDDVGDPTQTTYSIAQFQDGGTLTPVDSREVDVAELLA